MANNPYGGGAPAPNTSRRQRRRGRTFDSTGTTLAQRTAGRLKAIGGSVKGVDLSDGVSRQEARVVKIVRRRQKAKRIGKRAYKRYRQAQGSTPTSTPPSTPTSTD